MCGIVKAHEAYEGLRKNFIRHRDAMKLSQQKLAEKLGVSRQLVAAWESGRVRIPIERWLEFDEIYKEHVSKGTGIPVETLHSIGVAEALLRRGSELTAEALKKHQGVEGVKDRAKVEYSVKPKTAGEIECPHCGGKIKLSKG